MELNQSNFKQLLGKKMNQLQCSSTSNKMCSINHKIIQLLFCKEGILLADRAMHPHNYNEKRGCKQGESCMGTAQFMSASFTASTIRCAFDYSIFSKSLANPYLHLRWSLGCQSSKHIAHDLTARWPTPPLHSCRVTWWTARWQSAAVCSTTTDINQRWIWQGCHPTES